MFYPVLTDRTLHRKPVATLSLIAVCLFFQSLQQISGRPRDMIIQFGYIPGFDSLLHLFLHMFTHGGWMHFIGNSLFLLVIGMAVENTLGRPRFLLLYFAGGIAANAVHLHFAGGEPIPCVGASGAIAAVMGAMLMLHPFSVMRIAFVLPSWNFPVYTLIFLGLLFVRECWSLYSGSEDSHVAFGAHVGGFAAGMIWIGGWYGWNSGEEIEGRIA